MFNEDERSFRPYAYYRLTRDPGERTNLWNPVTPAPEAVEMFNRAGQYIDSHIETDPAEIGNLEGYEKEILETLGYL